MHQVLLCLYTCRSLWLIPTDHPFRSSPRRPSLTHPGLDQIFLLNCSEHHGYHFTFTGIFLSYQHPSHALEHALPWRKLLREGQSGVATRGNTEEAWENRFYSITSPGKSRHTMPHGTKWGSHSTVVGRQTLGARRSLYGLNSTLNNFSGLLAIGMVPSCLVSSPRVLKAEDYCFLGYRAQIEQMWVQIF